MIVELNKLLEKHNIKKEDITDVYDTGRRKAGAADAG